MAKRIYDFKCRNQHTTEEYVDSQEKSIICPECSEQALRIISGGHFTLDAISGDYPGATMKWAKEHEKAATK